MTDRPSPSHSDRRWAERIGQALDEGALESLDAGDDAVMQAVLAYREAVHNAQATPSPATSERIWAEIAAEIDAAESAEVEPAEVEPAEGSGGAPAQRSPDRSRTDRAPASPRQRQRSAWRIAAAAMLLVSVGLATWWSLQGPPGPLVAGTQSAVVSYETAGGAVVQLRPNSRLYRVDAYRGTDAVRFRLKGEAQFRVPTRSLSAFEVEAGDAVVRVMGTTFTVRTWTPHPEVFLAEGRVELRPSSGTSATLQPGQRGVATGSGVTVDSARAADYTGWLDQELSLAARPAGDVAAELSHHFDASIRLPDSVATQTLSGRLSLASRSQALHDLGTVLGGRFVETGEGTYRFQPEGASPQPN